MNKDFESKQDAPRIVEIVGPAGAGKTTLCQMLSWCDDIHVVNFPSVRDVASVPFFARYGLEILGSVTLTHPADLKELSRRQVAWLSILNGWPGLLERESRQSNDLIVLDQGPVYLLAEMSLGGPCFLQTTNGKELWQKWYRQWSSVLDTVVWLDAPDECLVQRIREREKDHVVKAKPVEIIYAFLKEYRQAYECTFSALAANRSCLKVLRFDTSRQAPEAIAADLFVEFNLQTIPSLDY